MSDGLPRCVHCDRVIWLDPDRPGVWLTEVSGETCFWAREPVRNVPRPHQPHLGWTPGPDTGPRELEWWLDQ
jgi:hypothetical protein